MGYNFPDAPTVGQVYQKFQWDGEKWVINPIAGGGSAICVFSDTPPLNPVDGCFWFETDSGCLFVRVNDGNSTQWVSATPPQDVSTLIKKTGDAMAGPLTLAANPVGDLEAVTKQYVDNAIRNAPWQIDVGGDAVLKIGASIVVRIKPTGLILTKDDIEVFSVSV